MKLLSLLLRSFLLISLLATLSCNNDDSDPVDDDPIATDDGVDDPTDDDDGTSDDDDPGDGLNASVEKFNPDLIYDGYVLVNDAASNRVFLMDKDGLILHEWPLSNNIGNDVFLMPDGRLLAILEADEPLIKFGGKGGKLQFVQKDGTIDWNFEYSSEDYITHHDAEMLPNGNVITLVWERIPAEEAMAKGWTTDMDLYSEAVIEIDPATDEIVWEWHAWDHIIQDIDDAKTGFGSVSDNPQLIDVNYNSQQDDGDIMHANGISYDAKTDLIYISINFYHEVWVIDHSTSTAEAASHEGGNFNRGGDLVYRFGNPETYKNPEGERLFHNNHYPNLLTNDYQNDEGKLLIFVNMMNGTEQSAVYELQLPDTFELLPNTSNELEIAWTFTDPDFFSAKVSGAVPLPNGNRMITEGDFGIWEVTRDGELVWQYAATGFFWRSYHYDKDAPGILALDL